MKRFFLIATLILSAIPQTAISEAKTAPARIAPLCAKCHQAEANLLRGFLKEISFPNNTLTLDLGGSLERIHFNNSTSLHNLNSYADIGKYIGEGFRIFYVISDNQKTALHIARLDPLHLIGEKNIITTADVEREITAKIPPMLIDIRPAEQYMKGHIQGAINIPEADSAEFSSRRPLPNENDLIIYGNGNDVSEGKSAIKALAVGFRNVQFYQGGLSDWARKHFTVCSLSYVKKPQDNNTFFLRLVDENHVLIGTEGLPVDLTIAPGSIRLIKKQLPEAKDQPIVVYGTKYENSAATLISMGYRQVKTITNGNLPWEERLASADGKDCSQ